MPNADSVKSKIQNLINQSNATTGASDTDLSSAVDRLISNYGQGGVELPTFTRTPATEADVVSSKQFIDESGNLRTGSMGVLGFDGMVDAGEDVSIYDNDDGSKTLMIGGYTTNTVTNRVDPGTAVIVMLKDTHEGMSVLGDAKPEDVRAGKIFTSKEGFTKVGTHVCTGGGSSSTKKPIVLEVEKITSDTYAEETDYPEESFVLLDIYPKSGGTVNVTYGDLTKTIVDDGTSEEPNAQQVFFGTFNGVTDEVETPASGTLTIEGDYAAFGCGSYNESKAASNTCASVTEVANFGEVEYIPDNAFGSSLGDGCPITEINIPTTVTSIGNYAFASCESLKYLAIPNSVTSLGKNMCFGCFELTDIMLPYGIPSIPDSAVAGCEWLFSVTIPDSVTNIGKNAFALDYELMYLRMTSTTPPTLGEGVINVGEGYNFSAIYVPYGCGEAYKNADGWSEYADYIVEM